MIHFKKIYNKLWKQASCHEQIISPCSIAQVDVKLRLGTKDVELSLQAIVTLTVIHIYMWHDHDRTFLC